MTDERTNVKIYYRLIINLFYYESINCLLNFILKFLATFYFLKLPYKII